MENSNTSRASVLRRARNVVLAQLMAASLLATVAVAQSGPPARPPSTRSDTGVSVTVTGTVFDSVAGRPLSGADVQIVDVTDRTRAYTVHADSLGRFRIDSVRPGKYAAGFFHPALDALGIEPVVRGATVSAGTDNTIALVIPGSATVMRALCPPRGPADSSGAIAGTVRDAETGAPVAGAKVVVSWAELVIDRRGIVTQQRRVPVQTGENGEYRICGVPGADTVLASAELSARKSGLVEVPIPIGGITRRDFALADSAENVTVAAAAGASDEVKAQTTLQHGNALLSGIATGPDGKPMSGAKVIVWGTGLEATTRSDGRFNLGGLPSGTFSAEARAIGFEPARAAVDLSSAQPASVQFRFRQRVQQLSRVTVLGKPSRLSAQLDDFLRRSRTGMGHYLLGSDESLKTALRVTDAMRMMPGVQITPSGQFGNVILLRGQCVPAVYVDGMEATQGAQSLDDLVSPEQVAGVEVYTGLGESPVQYKSNGCGVVLVWTKR